MDISLSWIIKLAIVITRHIFTIISSRSIVIILNVCSAVGWVVRWLVIRVVIRILVIIINLIVTLIIISITIIVIPITLLILFIYIPWWLSFRGLISGILLKTIVLVETAWFYKVLIIIQKLITPYLSDSLRPSISLSINFS